MSIQVSCHDCHKTFKVKDRYAGLTGACPYCGTMLSVPEAVEDIELEVVEDEISSTSTSSLSLLTKVPLVPCASCKKDILVGSATCFYCGAVVSQSDPVAAAESGEKIVRDQIQLAREQAQQAGTSNS